MRAVSTPPLSHELRDGRRPAACWDYAPRCPVYQVPASTGGATVAVLSDWDSVRDALLTWELRDLSAIDPDFAVSGVSLQHPAGMFPVPRQAHTALRAALARIWGPHAAEAYRQDLRCLARRQAQRVRPGEADLVQAFIIPYLRGVIELITGLRPAQADELTGLSERTTGALLRTPSDRTLAREAWDGPGGLYDFIAATIGHPRGPLMAATVHAVRDAGLEPLDPVTTIYNGIPTLGPTLTMTAQVILSHPPVMAALRHDPRLVRRAVRESLRGWAHFTFALPGLVTVDTQLGGRLIRAGTAVLPNLHGAEYDPGHGASPAVFDLYRPPRPILAWGKGPHICLGRHLAQIALEEFTAALAATRLELIPDPQPWLEGTMICPPVVRAA